MDARYYEAGLQQVASALIRLARPTPDAIDQLINQMNTIAGIAADADRGIISKIAHEAEAAAHALAGAKADERSACIEAVKRLGHWLLDDLGIEVARAQPSDTVGPTRRRVLIVDDSRVTATALRNAFQDRDFLVRTAVTLEGAFGELLLFSPQVLVSDIFMPDVEVELLARLFRSLSRQRPALLVLMSGPSGQTLLSRLNEVEPDIFISKMEGSAKVVEKVLAAWESSAEPSPPVSVAALL